MSDLTDEELRAIVSLCDEASSGDLCVNDRYVTRAYAWEGDSASRFKVEVVWPSDGRDPEFIACAYRHLRALAVEVLRLRQTIEAAEDARAEGSIGLR